MGNGMVGEPIAQGRRIALKNNYLKGVIIYEEKAKTVCEKCGVPGIFEKNLPWVLSLSAIHHYELKGKQMNSHDYYKRITETMAEDKKGG